LIHDLLGTFAPGTNRAANRTNAGKKANHPGQKVNFSLAKIENTM
jgi:hypothetical protein